MRGAARRLLGRCGSAADSPPSGGRTACAGPDAGRAGQGGRRPPLDRPGDAARARPGPRAEGAALQGGPCRRPLGAGTEQRPGRPCWRRALIGE